MNESGNMSRRDLLKASALIGGTFLAGGITLTQAQAKEVAWDYETDVVVVGYGGAGAAAAIAAFDGGAEVILLEKMEKPGGNTAVSLGGFINTSDPDAAYTYTRKLFDYSLAEVDEEIVRVFCDECAHNAEWVSALEEGLEIKKYGGASYKKVEGAESQEKWQVPRAGMRPGESLFAAYENAVEYDRDIDVMLNTPAKHLITNEDGEVIGVLAESNGAPIAIKARKGIALTCGGFEFDDEYKQNFLKGYPIRACGAKGNTGDGLRMAQEVGAKLWHMNGVSALLAFEATEDLPMVIMDNESGIIVDKNAQRFMDEPLLEGHAGLLAVDLWDTHNMLYPRIPCFMIFDDEMRKLAPFGWYSSGALGAAYKWSDDNLVEIENGWVNKADTIAELAELVGLDPAALEATVAQWNASVEAGVDSEWGRTIVDDEGKQVSLPIATPPFYAHVLYPTLLNTQGGPRRNAQSQVIDAFGEPIPRLYAAGELGSFWGIIYQGAGNNTESMVFGRIAGANLAALDPWDAE